MGQAKADRFTASCGTRPLYQLPEKPNARAKEPNPPRVTPPESDAAPDGERLDELSPPKKLLRDDHPPDQWPRGKYPRDVHSTLGCRSDAIPGWLGPQLALGISAYAPPPTAKVPISSSATWLERFTG
jgi:hypothetical protein